MSNPQEQIVCAILPSGCVPAPPARRRPVLVEGPQAVREALKAHCRSRFWMLYTLRRRLLTVMRILLSCWAGVRTPTPEEGRRVFMRVVTDEVLEAMADSVSPAGYYCGFLYGDASFSLLWGEGALNPKRC